MIDSNVSIGPSKIWVWPNHKKIRTTPVGDVERQRRWIIDHKGSMSTVRKLRWSTRRDAPVKRRGLGTGIQTVGDSN